MVTLINNTDHRLQISDPPVHTIRQLTAKIRREWSPEERFVRALQAIARQRSLLQR